MKENLVSIIMPMYNSKEYIEDAIKSVECQTYQHYELIIIDDASTDGSSMIAEKFCYKNNKIKLIKLKENVGAARARNIGIRKAEGEYLAFLDSDDIFLNNKIQSQIEYIKKTNCGFAYGQVRYIDNNKKRISNFIDIPNKINYKESLTNMRIIISTVMIDIKKIPKRYCYMPNVRNEDIATWWKILKKGYFAYGQKEVLTLYRKSKNAKSTNFIKNAVGRWYIYRKLEQLNLLKCSYYFIRYIILALKKRSVSWVDF